MDETRNRIAGRQIGLRVKELRERRGWTRSQLAAYAGVDPAYITNLEHGKMVRPGAEALERIARALGVPLHVLTQGLIPPPPPRPPQDLLRELERSMPIAIPLLSGSISAGPGSIVDYEYVPREPPFSERPEAFLALPVRGDCMEPIISDGDVVIVDTQTEARPGDIVVAEHDGQVYVKELGFHQGRPALIARQGQEPILIDETTAVRGVVIRVIKRLRRW